MTGPDRAREILSAELRGSTAEFLGWLTGLKPPEEKESIPPEMRPAFDKMLKRLTDAAEQYAGAAASSPPREPTADMRIAGGIAWAEALPNAETYVDTADACWKAMFDAAPRASSAVCRDGEWQPIETAPKGESILLCVEGYAPTIGRWWPVDGVWCAFDWEGHFETDKEMSDYLKGSLYEPTHWAPRPAGPNSDRVGAP